MQFIYLITCATAGFSFSPSGLCALPDLTPVGLQMPSVITSEPNPTVTINWRVANQGSAEAASHYNGLYLSTDPVLDSWDSQISNWYVSGPIAPGAVSSGSNTVVLPIGVSGDYYIFFATDLFNWIFESDESNNLVVTHFKFNARPADLAPLALQIDQAVAGPPNLPLTVVWAVTNLGPGTAQGPWLDTLYLTPAVTSTPDLRYVGQFYPPGPLAPGEVYWQTNTLRMPVYSSGSYYLILRTDDTNSLYETNMGNNKLVAPVTFTIQRPDLAPLALLAPTNIASPANAWLTLAWGVTNQGAGTALGPWSEVVYLSTNGVLDEQIDTIINYTFQTNSVPAGGAYWTTNSLFTTFHQSGSYYLIFKTDPYNTVFESDTNNNVAVLPITFTLQQPDLAPLTLQVPTVVTSAPNPKLVLSWGVTNQGTASATGWWVDQIYLSTNATLDAEDQCVLSSYNSSPLDVNQSYWNTNSIMLPVTRSGSYYLLFKTGVFGGLGESNTTNNVAAVPIAFTIVAPNLSPIALQAPGSFTGLPKPQIQLVTGITNAGPGPAEGYWNDKIYFSSSPRVDSSATALMSTYKSGPVAARETYWATNIVQLPGTQSGTFYFILQANEGNGLFESDYSDNVIVTPIQLDISPPDLAPVISSVPNAITSAPNPAITFVWGITNQGTGAATGSSWVDSIFLSTNSVKNGTETRVDIRYDYGPIAPGEILWLTNSVRLPLVASGSYYLLFEANTEHWLFEGDYSNNFSAVPVRFEIQPPDLAPIAFLGSNHIVAAPYPAVTLVWGVTNQGAGAAECPWGWSDQVFISTNDTLDSTALAVSSVSQYGSVGPGQTYWQTNAVRLPLKSSGTYHLFLKLDSWQNLVESDASNNVASLSLTFNAQLPDLALFNVDTPGVVTGPPNPRFTYSWGVTNQGAGTAAPYDSSYVDAVQLSSDPAWSSYKSCLSYEYQWIPLDVAKSYRRTNTVRAPVTQSGTYYLVFKTDANDSLIESDRNNNVGAVPIRFDILPPDLSPVAFLAPASVTGPPNPTITLVWGVTNQGVGSAVGADYWYDQVLLSPTPVWDSGRSLLFSATEPGPVAAGGAYWRTNNVRVPVVKSGSYFLLFKTDSNNSLYESDPSNNVAVAPISFDIHPPDLAPVTSLISNVITDSPNPRVTLVWGVTNQGTGTAIGRSAWPNRVYFSPTPTLDTWRALQLAYWSESDPLEPGTSVWQTNSVRVPVVESGTNYLIFAVNSDTYDYNRVYEDNYSNNIVAVPVSFEIQKPDLVPLGLQAPPLVTGPPNPTVRFVWGVTNQGLGAALPDPSWGNWVDSLYVSTNATFGHGEKPVSSLSPINAIPPGGTYWRTNSWRVPVVESGLYYILLRANANNFLHESDYSNNVAAIPVTFDIQPPDLVPVALQCATVVTSVPNPRLTLAWGVTNQGAGLADGYWYDSIFISTNSSYDGNARNLTSSYETRLPAGSSYWRSNSFVLPVVQSGTYFLIFQANSANSLIETDLSNNFLIKPVTFTIQPPDLAPIALQTPSSVSGPPNPSFEIAWGVTNQGTGFISQNQNWVDRVYLSTQPKRDRWANSVMAMQFEQGPVAPGQSYWRSQVVRAPVLQNGTYYLVFSADDENALFESDESNNIVAVPVTFEINPPDLMPLALNVASVADSGPNPTIQLVWGVTNLGAGPAMATGWLDTVYLSNDPVLDYSDTTIANRWEAGPIPAGGSYWRAQTARVPVYASGDYYLIFQTDSGNNLREANYPNNTVAVPVHFNISLPDLAPLAFVVPTNVAGTPNSSMTLVWGVTNKGAGAISETVNSWADRIFLSTNAVLDPNTAAVICTDFKNGPLNPGQTYWRTNVIHMPLSRDGTYYLFCSVASDPWGVPESDYSNNVAVAQVMFQLTQPDLALLGFLSPTQVTSAFPSVTLVWGVTNQGTGPAIGSPFPWSDSVALFGPMARQLWTWPQTNLILPGQAWWTTNTVVLPINKSGDYSLTLTTDMYHDLGGPVSTNTSTNVLLSANLVPPSIAPIYLAAQGTVVGPARPVATVIWAVTNQGNIAAWAGPYGYWQDRLYLSSNAVFDSTAVSVASWQQTDVIPAAGSYWRTNFVHLPVNASGEYFLLLKADVYNTLQQADTSNNVVVAPVKVTVLPLPDLAPVFFAAPSVVTSAPNPSVTLMWGVTNQGAGPAQSDGGWTDGLYFSSEPIPDGTERLIGTYGGGNILKPGEVYWRTNTARLPVTGSGTYYLIFKAACYGSLQESDFVNNTVVVPITFNIPVPDLTPIAFQAPGYVVDVPHPRITIVAGVTNQGSGVAFSANDFVYLSATPGRDVSSQLVAVLPRSTPVRAGDTYWTTNTVELPVADRGHYYLVFETDGDNTLNESNLLNNSAVVPIDLQLSLAPDLAVVDFQAPPFVVSPAHPKIELVWHIKNQGLGPVARPWSDAVLLLTNFSSAPAVLLGKFVETNPVPAGADYWRTNVVTVPATFSGDLYLKFCADIDGDLYEFDENDNEAYANVIFTMVTPSTATLGPGTLKADGSFELTVSGSKGIVYTLQTSTNLLDWVRVCDFVSPLGTTSLQDTAANASRERFYRVVISNGR